MAVFTLPLPYRICIIGWFLCGVLTVVKCQTVVVLCGVLVKGVWLGRPSECRKPGVWMPVWFVSCTILLYGVTCSLLHALCMCVCVRITGYRRVVCRSVNLGSC